MSQPDNTSNHGVRREAAIGAAVIGIQLFAVYLVLLVGLAGMLGIETSGLAITGGIAGLGALVSAWRLGHYCFALSATRFCGCALGNAIPEPA